MMSSSKRCLSPIVKGGAKRSKNTLVDINKYITPLSERRKPSAIRALGPFLAIEGMISLGGGMPNPALFPFKGMNFQIDDGKTITLSDKEVNASLQYSPTTGLPGLQKQLRDLQSREHKPQYDDWAISVSGGSQDSLTKAFEMVIKPGDKVLVDDPTYSGALAFLQPYDAQLIGVLSDKDGLIPEALRKVLEGFSVQDKPKVLYTIPTGQNPSGSTTTVSRRKEVYQLACDHDLIILEDDPYFFLHYGSSPAPAEDAQFTRPPLESYFSMDTFGRVIRFDSFSKVLSSGIRIGFATGPSSFIEKLNLHQQATSLHTCGVSQMMTQKLLEHWGEKGWNHHINKVALFYMRRRDHFMKCANQYLTGKAKWITPSAGMFVWLELNVEDSSELVKNKAKDAKVLLVPGEAFCPIPETKSNCVRAAFSTASYDAIDTALSRLGSLLQEK